MADIQRGPGLTTNNNLKKNTILLLTKHKGLNNTGEYWPKVMAKMTESQYSPVRLEQARLLLLVVY